MGDAMRFGLMAGALLWSQAAWAAPGCTGSVSGLPPIDCASARFQTLVVQGDDAAGDDDLRRAIAAYTAALALDPRGTGVLEPVRLLSKRSFDSSL